MPRLLHLRRLPALLLFGAVCAFLLAVWQLPKLAYGEPRETWSDLESSTLTSWGPLVERADYDKLFRQHESITGDLPCDAERIYLGTSEDDVLTPTDRCWYKSSNQFMDRVVDGGYMIRAKGMNTSALIDGAQSSLYPTPNSNVFVQSVPDEETGNFHLYFRRGEALRIALAPMEGSGVYNYTFINPPSKELIGPDSKPWLVDDNTIASRINYSSNHKWMSIWREDGLVARVNLETFTVSYYDFAYQKVSPGDFAIVDISPNGQYIAVSLYGQPLKLIDVSRCNAIQVGDSILQGCLTRELSSDVAKMMHKQEVLGQMVEFVDDDLLAYYIADDNLNEQVVYVRAPHTDMQSYIALGDSFASGEGEGNDTFYPETDIHDVNMCHLSKKSYPFLLKDELKLPQVHSVACSGAKILNVLGNGVYDKSLQKTNRTNQYNTTSGSSLGYWQPGYYEQIKFVKEKKPNIITISISGNDVGFADIINRCIKRDTCYDSYEDRVELVAMINKKFEKIVGTFEEIKQAGAPDARVYVVGYPSIIKPNGNCGLRQPKILNKDETYFADDIVKYLNSVIELASEKAGVNFIDAYDSLMGYRLCEGSGDSRAVNGATIGHDSPPIEGLPLNMVSNGSFHPNQLGHKLLAHSVKWRSSSFTKPMPKADDSINAPLLNDKVSLLQVPKSDRPTFDVVYSRASDGIIFRGSWVAINYYSPADLEDSLGPFTPVSVELHSNPINLGSLTTDKDGNITGSVMLPASVEPGFHALNLYAMGLNGEMHNITQTVFVAATPDDYDGDGIPNNDELCVSPLLLDPALGGDAGDCEELASTKPRNDSSLESGFMFRPLVVGSKSKSEAHATTISSVEDLTRVAVSNGGHGVSQNSSRSTPPVDTEGMPSYFEWIIIAGLASIAILFFIINFRVRKSRES